MNLHPELVQRRKELDDLWNRCFSSRESFAALEDAARRFQRDFPQEIIGYQATMMLIEYAPPGKAQELAQEMAAAIGAPAGVRSWSKGFLYRAGLAGKPVELRFTALDGREVDVARMRGQVVLVQFWGPGCRPCVRGLDCLKALYASLRPQGLEMIGIACATDREGLLKFIQEKGIDWPQQFEGQRVRTQNTMTQRFGINGIPHLFLLDKQGCLRQDNLKADNTLAGRIAPLLAE